MFVLYIRLITVMRKFIYLFNCQVFDTLSVPYLDRNNIFNLIQIPFLHYFGLVSI